MTVRVYRSTDASAPIMNGIAGSLVAVLDACLVNGYGSKVAAGWSKSYSSGSTLAAYQTGSGNKMFLRVDDTSGSSANFYGYENMSSISIGTGQFPTPVQLSEGGNFVCIIKSSSGGTAAVPWVVVANGSLVYVYINVSAEVGVSITYPNILCFGDIISYKSNDQFATVLIGGFATNNLGSNFFSSFTSVGTSTVSHYIARSFTQIPGAARIGKSVESGSSTSLNTSYPLAVDGTVSASPVIISESFIQQIRGILPGCWMLSYPTTSVPIPQGQQLSFTSGDLKNKTLECFYIYSAFPVFLEVSDTW
jgi:hypothetical protein